MIIQKTWRSAGIGLALATSLTFASVGPLAAQSAPSKGVYVGSEFYPPSAATQASARGSGFTRLFLFTLNVETNGDLTAFGSTLCSGGSYVGNASLGSGLAACKVAPTSVNRIEMCIGSAGSQAFANVKNLIASQGTGSTSILYKNFQALKNATGVDAIQFDDEVTYDATSMISFGNMLYGLGLKVTLCPYTAQSVWVSVKNGLGSKVDSIYLQCYDGGASNDPISWNAAFGGFKVTPGLWGNTSSRLDVMTKMRGWNTSADGLPGGFMWLNGTLASDAHSWSTVLSMGLDEPFYFIQNRQTGEVLNLTGGGLGDGVLIQTFAYNYNDANSRFAVVPTLAFDHFYLVSYVSANAMDISGGASANGATVEDRQLYMTRHDQWWDLIDVGNGYYKIVNSNDGKVIEATGTTNGSSVYQTTDTGATTQQWRFLPHGQYYIRSQNSNKYVSIETGGPGVVQYDYQDQPYFRWKFLNEVDGYFAVQTMNGSNRVIQVSGGSTTNGALLDTYDYVPTNIGNQEVKIRFKLDGTYKFYFLHDGKSWDIGGGSQANNAPVSQYSDTTNLWQQFQLERVHE